MNSFDISYWEGPPPSFALCEERIKEIADAGMTIADVRIDAETNKRFAALAEKYGMRVNIFDNRMWGIFNGGPGWEERLRRVICEYKDIPNLNCYFLKDEPIQEQFKRLREMKDIVLEEDPYHPCLINLFAIPALHESIEEYCTYLDSFIETFEPDIISYDHYNMMFEESGDELLPEADISEENRFSNDWVGKRFVKRNRGQFMDNLEIVRDRAEKHGLPWKVILQVTEHWKYRYLNEAELRWGPFVSLCYGPSEIDWFTYWTPAGKAEGWDYHHAMINLDGTKDPHYYTVRDINRELLLIGKELCGASCTEVLHVGNEPEDKLVRYFDSSYGDIKELEARAIVLGFFDNGCIMLANKDIEAPQEISFSSERSVMLFDKHSGGYKPLPKREDGKYTLCLAPGDGELLCIR